MKRARRVRFGRAVKVVGLELAAIGALTIAALAQPASRDVQFGVSETEPPGAEAQSAPDAAGEQEAKEFYNVVREKLSKGEHRSAQRLLEQLIARFPDTQIADEARRDLVALYSAEGSQRPSGAPFGEPNYLGVGRPVGAGSESSPDAVAGSPAVPETLHGWGPVVRHARTLQSNFRLVAGDRVFFEEGSTELSARAGSVIAAQAAWLKRYPQTLVIVEGHADDPGAAGENTALSESRAEAVRARLLEAGVEPERVVTKVFGRDRPVAICGETECAAQNRRAVSVVKRAEAVTEHVDRRTAVPVPGVAR
jgi:peptidoglycan-associated lipoprotein